MDSGMRLELTTDMDLVRSIVTEPEIWERAAEDGVDQDSWYPGFDAMSAWLICMVDDEPVGVILMHTDTSVSIKIHPYLRINHREKGRIMMRAFYNWIMENGQEKIAKVSVTIPENQRKVINFAKKVGFKKEGMNRASYLKNGQLYGQQNLGITRTEIEEYLDEQRS